MGTTRGLAPEAARALPSDGVLTILSVLVALVTVAGMVVLARLALGAAATLGASGPLSGLGTRREARDALSETALRRRAAVIRPDLKPHRRRGSRDEGR